MIVMTKMVCDIGDNSVDGGTGDNDFSCQWLHQLMFTRGM